MHKHFMSLLVFSLAISLFTSCYRMPTEDDYSLVPVTNNPDVTRDSGSALPQMSY